LSGFRKGSSNVPVNAAIEEVKSYVDSKHFTLMRRDALPKATKVLSAVWSMKRNRRILTREVYEWKAIMNCHGGQQEFAINFGRRTVQ
jgi:hypothetical protein